ncbi:MAG: DUF92 domain-containing protein [Methanomassiliicoccales archaeon]|nr:MAG: DUF92 domain-containing protein [Methanomassiliicoccales archaeon]
MVVFEYVLGVVFLCILLCMLAYWQKVLDKWGTAIAFFIGAIIGIFGGILWLVLLIFFLITSFGATKYKYSLKKERGVQEGKRGERHFKNVLANGFAPTFIALISYEDFHFIEEKWIAEVAFIAAIAVAASDTVASELGVFSDKTYLITNFKKKVKPGTSGGVSWLGQFWALIAAIYTAFFGWVMLFLIPHTFVSITNTFSNISSPSNSYALIVIPVIIGFLGCQIDSVLGATLEHKGWITNDGVNIVATCFGGLLAWMMILIVI